MTWRVFAVHAVVLVFVVGSGLAVSQAIEGRAAVARPVSIDAPLCPAASTREGER